MSKVIVDTSIFIGYLRGTSDILEKLTIRKTKEELELLVPHIVIVELFAGEEAKRKVIQEKINKLIEGIEVVGLTVDSAKKAGELIRKYRQIPDSMDLIIAAIAMEHKAQIFTYNTKHFKQIRGITLYDFSEMPFN